MIEIYNSQSRKLEVFTPMDPTMVTMYVCGPTVYGPAHIGNARPAIVFDQLFRLLRHTHGDSAVRYARNITDVDDKIIATSIAQGVPISQITDTATVLYHQDIEALSCLPPTVEPKATQSIQAMITLIKRLVQGKHAYMRQGEVFLFKHPTSLGLDGLRTKTRVILKESWFRSLQVTSDAEIDTKWTSFTTPWYPKAPRPGHRHAGRMLEDIRELCPRDFRMQIQHQGFTSSEARYPQH